ncbi:MAG: sodium:proton antiporter [Deltaproteobacteria bacterium]|nr:MAG: sodium:proton antiporter [Deltaproteobacteria bacterium]
MATNRFLKTLALITLLLFAGAVPDALAGHGTNLGEELKLFTGIPFAGILLSIALFPLFAPHFWHNHFGKISAFWGLCLAVPFLFAYKGQAVYEIGHIYLADYIPFIILLWALYTVAGGIVISGSLSGSPLVNTIMLLIGTAIASWVGTTGAAMLLIRPFLKANKWREKQTYQVVFFIFLVCNIGGALTPLGDPPLFLGFLHKVPFFWTLKMFLPMVLLSAILLAIFFVIDSYYYKKEKGNAPEAGEEKFKLEGLHNLIFLGGIIGAVLASGLLHLGEVSIFGIHRPVADLLRDAFLILMGFLSLQTTRKALREKNEFSWFPIMEVAYLFAGIFVTMIPVLLILKAGSHGAMAFIIDSVKEPLHYFWVTGALSSFLDNAPTYLVFFNTALGTFSPGMDEAAAVRELIANNEIYLEAISMGAVFMGANSYIGNAPNFMVRSIAEEGGVSMPSFFGYVLKFSLVFLVPSFLVITFVFLL